MKTILLSILAAVAFVPGIARGAPPTVVIKDDAYMPHTLTVNAGQTVTFVNNDDDAHTVTAVDGTFDSKGLDTNQSWKHTFVKPGTYAYFCQLHPFMKGTIVVQASK